VTDQVLTCSECGVHFVWGGEDVSEYCPMCRRLAPGSGRGRGVVKWFSRARGYGFITPLTGSDVFMHQSSLREGEQIPRVGQLVEFGLASGPRGVQAEDVVALN
jgi:cold shock protein